MIRVVSAKEDFPELDTVASPVVLCDGDDAYVCYQASHRAGLGNVVLKFSDVIDLHISPMNVDGLGECRYPVKPWEFNEVFGAEETQQWEMLNPRLWIISFRDVTLEIMFESVSFVARDDTTAPQLRTLISALG